MQFGVDKHKWIIQRQQNYRWVQCVVFENTCYYMKLQGKSNFFLTYNVHEKNHKNSGQTNFDSVHSSYLYFAFVLRLCIHVTWKCTPFQPIRNASFLLAKKLQYCVGGVCFQRHCDAVSVAGIARILGFINWLDTLNWPLQRVFTFWS